MKKILLIALTAIIGQAATAQKSNVKAAEVAYFAKDYEKGVKAITEAMNNEQTKAEKSLIGGTVNLAINVNGSSQNFNYRIPNLLLYKVTGFFIQ